jgi:hypothetical protein
VFFKARQVDFASGFETWECASDMGRRSTYVRTNFLSYYNTDCILPLSNQAPERCYQILVHPVICSTLLVPAQVTPERKYKHPITRASSPLLNPPLPPPPPPPPLFICQPRIYIPRIATFTPHRPPPADRLQSRHVVARDDPAQAPLLPIALPLRGRRQRWRCR